jgi:hypothetical protein
MGIGLTERHGHEVWVLELQQRGDELLEVMVTETLIQIPLTTLWHNSPELLGLMSPVHACIHWTSSQ